MSKQLVQPYIDAEAGEKTIHQEKLDKVYAKSEILVDPSSLDLPNIEIIFPVGSKTVTESSLSLPACDSGDHKSHNDTKGDSPGKRPLFNRFKGIIAILLATCLQALNPQILYHVRKNLHSPYSNSNFMLWMFLIYTMENLLVVPFALYSDYDPFIKPFIQDKKLILFFVLRGLGGSMILYVSWFALEYFNRPAPVAVITAMAPIFVYVNAFFVLGEKLGVVPVVNALIAIGGVITMNISGLLANDTGSQNNWIGTGFAGLAMLILSWVFIMVRLLRTVHPILVNLSFGIFGVIVHCIISGSTNTLQVIRERDILGYCACTSTLAATGNYLFNLALKYEQAGVVSLIRTTEVIFSFIYQYYLFGLDPQTETALGALLILVGVVCVTFRKIVMESPETSNLRKYFGFLLY